MSVFEFIAKRDDGEKVVGSIESTDSQAVYDTLVNNGFYPISVKQKKRSVSDVMQFTFFERVKVKDLVIFSRQLAVMASASLPLVKSLHIMVDQTENPLLQKVIMKVADDVEGGSKFSQALAGYPKIFSNFFVSMVRSGETSGRLDNILNYLADQQEKDYDLTSKIKGAMIYPAFIVFGLVAVGVVMMVFVIPRLTSVLTESGVELPLSTKILIGMSGFMATYWWLLVIIIIGAISVVKLVLVTNKGRYGWDVSKVRVPIFGQLFKYIYLVRITRSLFTLLQGGVPLPQSLEITADVVSNEMYKRLIIRTKKEVDDGNSISTIFMSSSSIPPMASQMMSVGEKTGKLDHILEKLTGFYSREIENMIANLVSLIEPLIMVVLGLAVGIMVAAIILPMYNLASGF